MKKFLSLALAFTVSSLGLISLSAQSVRAQQVATAGKSISEIKEEYERLLAVDRDPSTPAEVREINQQFLEKRRTQLRTAIEGRLGALRKYQTSMSGMLSAEEGLVVGNSIQALEKDLSGLSGEPKAASIVATAAPRARIINTAATMTPASGDAAPVSRPLKAPSNATVTGNLFTAETASMGTAVVRAITLSGSQTCQQGIVTITLSAGSAATTPLTVTVTETATNTIVGVPSTVALSFNVFTYTQAVNLAVGSNTIAVRDASGSEAATMNLVGASCPAVVATPTPATGGLVGLLVGGAVSSQQAENFSQADPFMGFVAGYSHFNDKGGPELHWRVQGIFQVQPKKEEAPTTAAAADASPTPTPAASPTPTPVLGSDFRPFLASRKTFDINMHGWIDWRFPAFGGIFGDNKSNPNVRVGVYGLIGASTYLDKNELKGDQKVKVDKDTTELDPEQAQVNNDLDKFWEAGLIGNFFKNGDDKAKRSLFMQAIIGYGRYESLEGFNPGKSGFLNDSRNRFIGKLRVFPKFLDSNPAGGADSSPMFGVEINAGRGPDQIKFFTGIATAFKLFK